MIRVKRVYDPPEPSDGPRFLVDRVWPRGLKKEATRIDAWQKDAAPSHELRRWFGHDPGKWHDFQSRYETELDARPEAVRPLLDKAREGDITLVYGARDREHNNAVVIKEYLDRKLGVSESRLQGQS